ncbi:MFS transporter [Mycolicibacterium sp. CH28]|uniref:peptide MFS transporter n=1 Tax=Mycolicibacterium sp. CH28 TaxID=2512237 RepID=UPI00108198CB|nr:oligopeptide:H+ symporter [Mycolicibacterium sp. CH28]TGD90626.1 MFS transporter [Mycolicibacterium sp. CH28]
MAPDAPGRTILLGHPVGLANLLGIELWERFSFYGMLTLLGYYLYYSVADGGLGLPRSVALGVVGAYGGTVYLATIAGGWIADRVLGMERTVFYGGVGVMLGHVALALLPGLSGVAAGLGLVAVGSGALKANTAALLGTLYERDDPRRDGGFTFFYFGANVGALLGPLITGMLQTRVGFHYGFGAAAIGMTAGLVQYTVYRRNLATAVRGPLNPLPRGSYGRLAAVVLAVVAVIVGSFATGLVSLAHVPQVITAVLVAASVGYFTVLLTSPRVAGAERSRVVAFIPLFLANVVFATLFQQIFTVLAVYSAERMNWSLFGWIAPPSAVASVEPVWLILFAPVFAVMWTKLGSRAPSTPRKVAYGVIGIGVTFLLFVPLSGTPGHSVPALAVAAIMIPAAMSELMLAPIGLSVTTQLAPPAFRGQMMALYFFSVGLGTSMSGLLARFYDPADELAYFGISGTAAVVAGAIVFALAPRISRLMNGVH